MAMAEKINVDFDMDLEDEDIEGDNDVAQNLP